MGQKAEHRGGWPHGMSPVKRKQCTQLGHLSRLSIILFAKLLFLSCYLGLLRALSSTGIEPL